MTDRLSPLDPPLSEQLELDLANVLPHMPGKDLLRIDEAAVALACSVRQVQYFIEDGSLRAINISRKSPLDPGSQRPHVRVPRTAIQEFINSRRTV